MIKIRQNSNISKSWSFSLHLLENFWVGSLASSEILLITLLVFLVCSDDNCSTEAKIVLKGNLAVLDLALVGHAADLPAEFSTLS
jgi:hypothetical protein